MDTHEGRRSASISQEVSGVILLAPWGRKLCIPYLLLGVIVLSVAIVPALTSEASAREFLSAQRRTTSQDEWVVLFSDDFGRGNTDQWELETGWRLIYHENNFVLRGTGRRWARLRGQYDWTDYSVSFRMKIIQGGVHLNYRLSPVGRYFLGFGEHGALLRKEVPWGTFYEQGGWSAHYPLDTWYFVEILACGGTTQFFVDGQLYFEYTDAAPLVRGVFALETLEDSEVLFDDILVVGEPPPGMLTWTKLRGPLGGLGYDVRIDPVNPDVMYVTDNFAGVAKSVDGGNTWIEKNDGISARGGPSGDAIPIFCLTIDSNDHQVIWAGAKDVRGIFKSTDAAESWRQMDRGITEASGITLRSFTIEAGNSDVVYCGAEIATGEQGLENERVKGKIYKTLDGGENWNAIWAGDSLVRHIIIDPTDAHIIYAATGIFDREGYNSNLPDGPVGGLGILKSTDGGVSWQQINNGLGNLYVGYLTMHPEDGLTLYAATGNYPAARVGAQSGLFVTHDGGQTWSQVLEEPYFPFTAVRISTLKPSIMYAGAEKAIWRSEDSGATWAEFNKGDDTYGPPGVKAGIPIDLTIDPREGDHIYVNNYGGGVFQSDDGGRNWRDSSAGYSGAELRDLVVSSSDYHRVYVIGRSGPFLSTDAGESWVGIRYADVESVAEWYAIKTAPDDDRKVLMADEGRGIIYLSTNGGASWSEAFRHPGELGDVGKRHGFKALSFAPSDSSTVYAGMCARRIDIEVYYRNDPSYGVYVSRDGGSTWQEKNNGLSGTSALNIHDIAVHPTRPGTAYAATNDSGVFMSTDFGDTWTQKIAGFVTLPPYLSVRALAIDVQNPDRMFCGVENGGIYVSTNAGETWTLISAGMDPWAAIRSIVINPANPNIVIAGDWHSGIYCTSTGGEPWTYANTGLKTRAIVSLLYSRGGGVLYAATDGGGVFRCYPDSDRDGLPDLSEDRDDDRVLDRGETDPHNADTDGDGASDGEDAFPRDPSETADVDGDGMGDAFEQRIVDDCSSDGINQIQDVLPGDDYDGDGRTNLREFLDGTDPLDPESYLPVHSTFSAAVLLSLVMILAKFLHESGLQRPKREQ